MHARNKLLLILCSGLFIGLGCAQVSQRPTIGEGMTGEAPHKEGVDHFAGEPAAPGAPVATAPVAEKAHRVAVVLGPGGYKSFAHVGVLKELIKHNVPVHKVVGLEWGALVAGLYAQRGQINEVEWKLYKLEKLDLSNSGFFGRKKEIQSLSILDSYLKENLDLKDVGQAAVPFFCPSLLLLQGSMQWQEKGPLSKAVANCLAYPPLFNSESGSVAALFSFEEVMTRLKQEGFDVIILVNVIGDGNLFDNATAKADYSTAILWSEVRRQIWQAKSRATDFIEVNTRGIDFLAFESRKLLVTAGEAASDKASEQIVTKYGF